MALSMHVDPFAVEDPSELPDWRLPLSFMKSRHTEKIEGDQITEDSWRMKDRVRRVRVWGVGLGGCMFVGNLLLHDSEGVELPCESLLSSSHLSDEDMERSSSVVSKHWC